MKSPSNPPPLFACLIADDLTGACDAAVAFARVGLRTEVLLDWSGDWQTSYDVLAVTIESRDIPSKEARNRIKQIASHFNSTRPTHLFKKIDSVFRGNTVVEIDASIEHLPHELAILAPSFPAVGRTVVNGILESEDLTGRASLDIASILRSADRVPKRIAITEVHQHNSQDRFLLCDAKSTDDLTAIVKMGLLARGDKGVLWIGSGGLASALATTALQSLKFDPPARSKGRVIFVIGSDHPVTLAQVTGLRESLVKTRHDCAVVDAHRDLENSDLREKVLTADGGQARCIFVTGGDTAMKLCKALGIERLQVIGEFASGVPMTIAHGGERDGMSIIMKSGGFGSAELLRQIADQFSTSS